MAVSKGSTQKSSIPADIFNAVMQKKRLQQAIVID